MKDRAFTDRELLARPDAAATIARLKRAVREPVDAPQVDLVAVLVLRVRAAAERAAEARA